MIRCVAVLALCTCATARDAKPTLRDALPAEVVEAVRAIRDPVLMDWLATTDFDDGSIDAVQCRLGRCVSEQDQVRATLNRKRLEYRER